MLHLHFAVEFRCKQFPVGHFMEFHKIDTFHGMQQTIDMKWIERRWIKTKNSAKNWKPNTHTHTSDGQFNEEKDQDHLSTTHAPDSNVSVRVYVFLCIICVPILSLSPSNIYGHSYNTRYKIQDTYTHRPKRARYRQLKAFFSLFRLTQYHTAMCSPVHNFLCYALCFNWFLSCTTPSWISFHP